ncbi:serine hydrolase domain-containing protein [Streptomyces sp. NPDC003077]|uniref:serine hydrolase domain-containing protein n=1 Tax=Streptomyces sp. NPDC003077 TaxID=3154443 RepID=UPI0033AC4FC3
MTQRATRTAILALAVTAVVGTATVPAAHASAVPAGSGTRSAAMAPAHDRAAGHAATLTALRQVVEAGRLPGVAAEVRHGKEQWFASAGFADTATGRRRSAGEHFRAASITKPFLATVLLQLEEEGRLSLADTVEKWLPGVVRGNGNDGRKVTLRSLLNHTSGLYNHTEDEAFRRNASGIGFLEHRYDTHTPEELVALAMTRSPKPDPEEEPPYYSNTNFVLAGMVVEKVTGRSYAQEVTRRVIKPLRLRGTSFPGTSPWMPAPHPVGYSTLNDKTPGAPVHDATEQNMTWLSAAGDMISTLGDINRFHRALLKGELLSRPQVAKMLDAVPTGDGPGYGLGVETVELSCGKTVVGKTGRTNGSLSAVAGTVDGDHQLTFNINGDWLPDPSVYTNVIEAEFCGRIPAREGRPGVTSASAGGVGR